MRPLTLALLALALLPATAAAAPAQAPRGDAGRLAGPRRERRQGELRPRLRPAAGLRRPAPGGLRLGHLSALPPPQRPDRLDEGRVGRGDHARLPRRRVVLRPGGPQHRSRRGASAGRFVEFWGLDRRSNCLEDHTGVAGRRPGEGPRDRVRLLLGGPARSTGGSSAGSRRRPRCAFLASFGLERTVRDWYAVIRAGFPDPKVRAQKVVCGGHSLGGPDHHRVRLVGLRRRPATRPTRASSSARRSPASTRASRSGCPVAAAGSTSTRCSGS